MAQAAAQPAETGAVLSQSSRQGTQREYETVTIIKPETGKPEILALIKRMQGIFGERKGKLLKIDSWGMRVLSYPVKKNRKGIYLHWRFLGGSDIVREFERVLGLTSDVVRFYTIRIDEDVDPEARPSEVTEELLDAAAEPGPDPDELRRRAEEAAAKRAAEEAAAAAAAAAAAEAERAAAAAAAAEAAGSDDSNEGGDAPAEGGE